MRPPVLLDVTRLVSRIGRGPWTGIDRVEAAWLRVLLSDGAALFGLVRIGSIQYLLDRPALSALLGWLQGNLPAPRPGLGHRLRGSRKAPRLAIETQLARVAMGGAGTGRLAAMLARHMPAGAWALNLGHTNLSDAVLAALGTAGLRRAVFVHDMIPLDYPQFQRPGTPEAFALRMRAVSRLADAIICNSTHSLERAQTHMARWGRCPPGVVAHLGLDGPAPAEPLPASFQRGIPYFVTVGTIEPRKNHALLLDIWERLDREGTGAHLHIIGQRGWENRDVFARLDRGSMIGKTVFEHNSLTDGQVRAAIEGAVALLLPSHAEGFGLPALEAAALGTPVVCAQLPSVKEVLGGYPLYLEAHDFYDWVTTASSRGNEAVKRDIPAGLPTWDAHVEQVFRFLAETLAAVPRCVPSERAEL